MKKVLAVAKGWFNETHLTNREKVGNGVAWVLATIVLYGVSRYLHLGWLSTFSMVTILPFLFAETYSFFAIRDRLKKERGEKEQA